MIGCDVKSSTLDEEDRRGDGSSSPDIIGLVS